MKHPSRSNLVIGLLLVLIGATFAVGCATSDVITYSRDTQRKGISLYNDGEYADAAGVFRNAARQNPRDYKSYYYLGACYEKLNQYQQAIQSYDTARGLINVSMAGKYDDDFRIRIINGLGRSIARCDQRDIQTDAAVAQAETKSSGENWFVVAKIYAFRGDADSAMDAFNRAALLAPQNFMIQKDYGLYLEQVGQLAKAQAPLKRAYALNGNDEQVAQALRRVGVVPGPSLKPQSALVNPPVPKGPIPELETSLDFMRGKSTAAPSPTPSQSTVEAPRD